MPHFSKLGDLPSHSNPAFLPSQGGKDARWRDARDLSLTLPWSAPHSAPRHTDNKLFQVLQFKKYIDINN